MPHLWPLIWEQCRKPCWKVNFLDTKRVPLPATRQRPGCFERAENGTLFLDEVTEMSAKSQIDLLRVLETGQYSRVGGDRLLSLMPGSWRL